MKLMKTFSILLLSALLLSVSACTRTPPTLPAREQAPILYPLGDFTLTERSGRQVSKADLLGKVWVASFVFVRCTGPCPQVTTTMARLQQDVADLADVRLVTFTVDPARDDPAELRKYADHFHADKERWLFLTGDEKDIHSLLQDSFKVATVRNEKAKPGEEFEHSTLLAVVDRQGNVRGYGHGTGDADDVDKELKKLKEMVLALRAEKL
jgi:protein SCO1